jgi:transposase
MSKPLLEDRLWRMIEPILPKPRPRRRRHPGRKPLDDRTALRGILFVLKTGIAWEDFPCEMGCCGMTLLNRLRQWQRAGVWDELHRLMLDELRAGGRINLSRVIVDSASVRATHGGKKRGRAPWTAGKTARNTT